MRQQTKPTRWTCLATAFAMCLNMDVRTFMQHVGHDGSEIIFPHLPEPECRRGHHIQECIDVCRRFLIPATPIELMPTIANRDLTCSQPTWFVEFGGTEEGNWKRFHDAMWNSVGVLTGVGHRCGHAVAFYRGRIYNPDGGDYDYSREACEARGFYTQCFWKLG